MPKALVDTAISGLNYYAVFSKVTIFDDSDKWRCYGVDNLVAINSYDLFKVKVPDSQRQRYILVAGHDTSIDSLADAEEVEQTYWQVLDILAKIPKIYSDTSESFLPHRLDLPELEGAISFSKGCYTGQEIIARMEFRGEIKHHLYPVFFVSDGELVPGMRCYNDEAGAKNLYECVDLVKVSQDSYLGLVIASNEYYGFATSYLKSGAKIETSWSMLEEKLAALT